MKAAGETIVLTGPVLVFGGPYGNLEATRAVFAEARRRSIAPNNIVCTGDLAAYCADPRIGHQRDQRGQARAEKQSASQPLHAPALCQSHPLRSQVKGRPQCPAMTPSQPEAASSSAMASSVLAKTKRLMLVTPP